MKSRKAIGYACFYGALLLPVVYADAQERKFPTRAEIEAEVHPVLLEYGASILRFDSCRQSIGILKEEDSPRMVHFTFRNVSGKVVRLSRVKTTCGCAVAAFPEAPLQPEETGCVSLTFHPKNRVGTVDTQAFVYTQLDSKRPVACLSLTGEVVTDDEWRYLPKAMGVLRLKRKQLVFSGLTSSSCPSERILCANSGEHPLKLSAKLLPSYASFRTEPEVIAPHSEAELVVTIDGSKLPSAAGNVIRFSLLVDGLTGRPSERMLEVVVKRDSRTNNINNK